MKPNPPADKHIYIPITKVEEQSDGSVIVEGFATVEELDSQGEVVLYEASKAAFAEWADVFSKMTDGESLGNIREMHDPKAAGKAIAYSFDDEKKGVILRSKIIDPTAAAKCKERVYTGYSIAALGKDVHRSMIDWNGTQVPAIDKYLLSETSLVDRGACPSAVFSLVKRFEDQGKTGLAKADETEVPAEPAETPAAEPAPAPVPETPEETPAPAPVPDPVPAPAPEPDRGIVDVDSNKSAAKPTAEKGAAEAVTLCQQLMDGLKRLAAELTLLEGTPDIWAIGDVLEAMYAVLNAESSAQYSLDNTPLAQAKEYVFNYEAITDQVIAKLGVSKEALAALCKTSGSDNEAAVKSAVEVALAPVTTDFDKKIAELAGRIESLEAQPATVGTPAKAATKSLGSNPSGDDTPASITAAADIIRKMVEAAEANGASSKQIEAMTVAAAIEAMKSTHS